VSLLNTDHTTGGMAVVGARAKDVAAQAVPAGKRVGTTAVQGARQGALSAKEWAAPHLEDAVRGAREWAAPRLEDAADAVDVSVAPKVSSALRATARQVRPTAAASPETSLRKLLDWRWLVGLGAALAAAGGAAAVTIRRRYASATADAEDATEPDAEEGAPPDESPAGSPGSEVNGRVTTPGR
jgi:hypothetical protein